MKSHQRIRVVTRFFILTFFNLQHRQQLKFSIALSLITLLLSYCASSPPLQEYAQLTISNTGSYALPSPQICYYQQEDKKSCNAIDSTVKQIPPKKNAQFKIKANHRVRLVLPFDSMLRTRGVVYRPNCHILIDFVPYPEKKYYANGQIISNANRPENGFNCSSQLFEQASDVKESNTANNLKIEMKDSSKHTIRYRIPRKNDFPADYISNYLWL